MILLNLMKLFNLRTLLMILLNLMILSNLILLWSLSRLSLPALNLILFSIAHAAEVIRTASKYATQHQHLSEQNTDAEEMEEISLVDELGVTQTIDKPGWDTDISKWKLIAQAADVQTSSNKWKVTFVMEALEMLYRIGDSDSLDFQGESIQHVLQLEDLGAIISLPGIFRTLLLSMRYEHLSAAHLLRSQIQNVLVYLEFCKGQLSVLTPVRLSTSHVTAAEEKMLTNYDAMKKWFCTTARRGYFVANMLSTIGWQALVGLLNGAEQVPRLPSGEVLSFEPVTVTKDFDLQSLYACNSRPPSFHMCISEEKTIADARHLLSKNDAAIDPLIEYKMHLWSRLKIRTLMGTQAIKEGRFALDGAVQNIRTFGSWNMALWSSKDPEHYSFILGKCRSWEPGELPPGSRVSPEAGSEATLQGHGQPL
ncbi:hypothetical protein BJ742DRAFT_869698 [Cladochytrium replicatum]|nr:hypothetical protein BJ742DRAFT_869698 [Cladochytrium replicatum]